MFQSTFAVSCCYGNGLSWYRTTSTDFVQRFNLMKNLIQTLLLSLPTIIGVKAVLMKLSENITGVQVLLRHSV